MVKGIAIWSLDKMNVPLKKDFCFCSALRGNELFSLFYVCI